MSHFALTRSTWVSGTALFAAELASIDSKTFKAINGDEGGTWAPSSPIVVGGAGMTITMVGASTAEGLFVTQTFDSAFGSNAYFRGATQFRETSVTTFREGAVLAFRTSSDTTFEPGSFLNINGSTVFTGDLTLNNRTTVTGPLDINAAMNFGGTSTTTFYSGSDLNFDDGSIVNFNHGTDLTAATPFKFVGTGRTRREAAIITSATTSISPLESTVYFANNITADTTVQIANDGIDGDELFISTNTNLYRLVVKSPSGSILTQLRYDNGVKQAAFLKKILGTWYVLAEIEL